VTLTVAGGRHANHFYHFTGTKMTPYKFSEKDIRQITDLGQTVEKIHAQLALFQQGTPFVKLDRPCTAGDGITRLSDHQIKAANALYETAGGKKSLVKFVPASGAATRMFKKLIQSYEAMNAGKENPAKDALSEVMDNCRKFAFYKDLESSLATQGMRLDTLIAEKDPVPVLRHLLTKPHLNYADLPKGLIRFHSYPDHSRTAFEEHLVEAAGYARTHSGECALHFTVPPQFKERFIAFYQSLGAKYEKSLETRFQVAFSTQRISTDTIAADTENRPFRLPDGSLLFRPGGHGALIHNLNEVDADIVFIKNIDNVAHERLNAEITRWKKILCGHLIGLQQQIFDFLRQLDQKPLDAALTKNIRDFLKKDLLIGLPKDFTTASDARKKKTLVHLLDRPLRVCGMVENTGDPGGGPFWIKGRQSRIIPQIIETAQIDTDDPAQQSILNRLGHFNPVDLVCGIRNWRGEKFNLTDYVDDQAIFIATKSENGRDLKALELPGLWNGAMAYWNTVFAEVPKLTFNPVKEVTDLLDGHHQPAD
jgi:hypothetical protein